MRLRVVWVLLGVALLAAACAPAGEGPSLVTGRPDGQGPSFEVLAVADDVPVGDMVAADTSGESDGVLVLVSAGIDSLTVRWAESFAPNAAGFRLAWRLRPAPDDEDPVWWGVDLDASVRTYTIGGLAEGTRYRLRLTALDANGGDGDGEFAVAGFETLAPPVQNLTGTAVANDAVRVGWDGPDGWSPVGYVVQWRLRGPNEFLGRLELPAGRRSQLVTGLGGGTEYVFRVTARTAAGWQSKPAAVGVTTPAAPEGTLRIDLSAPHHCTAKEGLSAGYGWGGPVEDEYWVREGVASVPVQWRVSGGQGPYVVRVAGAETQGAAGTTEVTCAKAGIDLNNLKDPDLDVVESGPKTITIQATDATGATTTKTHTFEVTELVGSAGSFYDGVFLTPGRTYYNWGRFFETPEGEHIAYVGPVQAHLTDGGSTEIAAFRHVVDGAQDTTAWFDIFSGELRGRWPIDETKGPDGDIDFFSLITLEERAVWDVFFASMRHTPFPEGDPRNEPPIPLATELDGATSARQLAITAVCTDQLGNVVDTTTARHSWRPYGQLPNGLQGLRCSETVVVHPRLLAGDSVTVCVEGAIHDDLFSLPAGLFNEALDGAVGNWNTLLAGLGRDALDFDAAAPACPANLASENVAYIRVIDRRNCQVMNMCPYGIAGSAESRSDEDPPRIGQNILRVFRSVGGDPDAKREELERVFRHEFGHFLGLADYGYGCWRLIDDTATVQPSLMSYGQLQDRDGNPLLQPDGPADPTALDPPGCRSAMIETRDLDDLHAIYHPDAVTGLTLRHNADGSSVLSWSAPAGTPSEYNAASLGIFQRALLTRDTATGAPAGPGVWGLLARSSPDENRREYMLPGDVGGYEYAVAGLTGGDHRRGSDIGPAGLRHGHVDVTLPDPPGGSVSWTLGEASNVVSAPGPVGVYTSAFDGFGNVDFGGSGAHFGTILTHFGASRSISTGDGAFVRVNAGDLLIRYQSVNPNPFSPAAFVPVTIQYGATTITATACDQQITGRHDYFCLLNDTGFSLDLANTPLRLIVRTAPGAAGTSPIAGAYAVRRNPAGFTNYGASSPGQWRFAFWNSPLTNLTITHGGPVTLRSGDIVISHAEPWGPNGFADSPFAPGRFTPLRITHGTTVIGATSCTTHFYNMDRYECHIAGAFTFNRATIPDQITVNPGTRTTTRGADSQPDRTPSSHPLTTCTTADPNCGRPNPTAPQPPDPDKN